MTTLVLVALAVIGLVDGACSGLRSGLGRTGLVDHTAADRKATAKGAMLLLVGLLPATLVFTLDVAVIGTPVERYRVAGTSMLMVLLPYALVVGLALGAYAVLGWRQKYVAMAVVLGPFTLARPAVAVAAAAVGAEAADSGSVLASIALATLAVLAVEPMADRRWGERELGRRRLRHGPVSLPPDGGH